MQTLGGVLFDIDGVLVTSWEPIEGARETIELLDKKSIARTFLTNTTSKTRAQIAEALSRAGMSAAEDEVLTAAALTAGYVREHHPGARCYLLNSGEVREDMPGIEFVEDDPDVIVLGGAGEEFSHRALSAVYEWMSQGVPVVAMHRSMTWSTFDGLRIDTGIYLTGLEESSGRKAIAVGKPAPAGFLAAAHRMGVDPEDVVMVGDDLHNDVLAAQVVGMTGVLVKTGKFRPDTLERWARDDFAMQPDHVIDTVADLPTALGL
ncbi:HAD-IIA family hydrolase [Aldersonia kunmingensis]|uniref:HAD-IIA family hydrolase n=1 Tax=Aldersonia kunmingensis TaxID=408066 RepID=UPI00082BA699|nr:HAD-IIA family hydrolase [Aldersonia kunmingensis]